MSEVSFRPQIFVAVKVFFSSGAVILLCRRKEKEGANFMYKFMKVFFYYCLGMDVTGALGSCQIYGSEKIEYCTTVLPIRRPFPPFAGRVDCPFRARLPSLPACYMYLRAEPR